MITEQRPRAGEENGDAREEVRHRRLLDEEESARARAGARLTRRHDDARQQNGEGLVRRHGVDGADDDRLPDNCARKARQRKVCRVIAAAPERMNELLGRMPVSS